jgi:hypothetical protein
VAVAPDGSRIVIGSNDATSRLVDLAQLRPPPETRQALVDHARAVVPRCLTIEQRKTLVLGPSPPDWCIEMGKYPYDARQWKAWKAKNTVDAVDSETATAYGNFANKAVKDGDFRIALAAAELGITFGPEEIWIRGNRAHALMFLKRIPEARDEYLKHRGTIMPEHGLWEKAIVDDFQIYRKQGREHELMKEIEDLFSLPVKAGERPDKSLPSVAGHSR